MPITLETPHALIELLLPLPGIAKNSIIYIVGNAITLELLELKVATSQTHTLAWRENTGVVGIC